MPGTSHQLAAALFALAIVLVNSARVSAQSEASDADEGNETPATFVSTFINNLQPPARAPALSTAGSANANAARSQRGSLNNRLASAPDMFGDYFQTGGDLNFGPSDFSGSGGEAGSFSVPSSGGGGPVKIGENNRALPTDRISFAYSHFQNAFQFTETPLFGAGTTQTFPLDRYTFGFEKTFADGIWSLEIRMPFQGDFEFQGATVNGAGGSVGNLALIFKHLLYIDQELSVVAGLGIETPTGSSFTVTDTAPFPANQLVFQNDALYLLPYIGALWGGDRPYFINAFLQLDFATGGNRIDTGDVGGPLTTLGRFNQQNLLFLDLGSGYWLYQNDASEGLNSLAAILELHYTSSLQDTDTVTGDAGGRVVNFTNNANRFDILNLTAGLQAQFNTLWFMRVACVVPLGAGDDNRFFDAEVQVQVNRRF
jgi:hypothetical protein